MVGDKLKTFWDTDSNWTFTAGLYPRLVGMDGTAAALVAATPIFLYDNPTDILDAFNTAPTVTKSFTVGTDNGVAWASSNPSSVAISGSAATVTRKTTDTAVTLTARKGNASRSVALKVLALPLEATPSSVSIDFINETLTNLTANASYKINGNLFTATGGTIAIDSAWFDTTVSIVKAGNGTSTQDSEAQSLSIPSRPATPSAPVLGSKTSTAITVTAVPGQEYSKDNGLTWQDGGTFSGLTANTAYSIITRVKTTGLAFASETSSALSITTNAAPSAVPMYTITIKSNSGGLISPASASIQDGASATFTVKANTGYKISKVLVDGVSVGAVSSYTFSNVTAAHVLEAVFAPWENSFSDVSGTDWFYSAVEYISKAGIMNGTSQMSFGPKLPTNRGMIVTILWRVENEPEATPTIGFKDMESGAYYTKAVAWTQEKGVVTGYNANTFGPGDDITREQLALILWRYAKYKGYDVSVGENTNILRYTDAAAISEYAIPAMQWACGAGLINGRTESTLDPKGYASRAEVAKILMIFMEKISKT